MNTPVSFELAKLLKEVGFPQFSEFLGCKVPNTLKCYTDGLGNLYDRVEYEDYPDFYTFEISAPISADVVMWIYEKYGVWISVDTDINGKFRYILRKYNSIDRAWEVKNAISISEYFKKPSEAYEAAIKYCLTEIINP